MSVNRLKQKTNKQTKKDKRQKQVGKLFEEGELLGREIKG